MDTHSQIVEHVEAGRTFCVAVVLSAEGSTPREVGVKAIVEADGRIVGTVGGGVVEAAVQRAGVEACRTGRAAIVEVMMEGEAAAGSEPVCGGVMRILVDPTARKDLAAYQAAATAARERRKGLLLTAVHGGARVETEVTWHSEEGGVHQARPQSGTVGIGLNPGTRSQFGTTRIGSCPRIQVETARECLADGAPRLVTTEPQGEPAWLLTEPIIPSPRLFIAGGGHVGQALAAQAVLVGFDVTVIDDRPEFADPARFPDGVTTRCGDSAALLAEADADEDTYIVIVTRGHRHDAEALRACLGRPAAYIGMIGSRRKVALTRGRLLTEGAATEEELDAVYAPIGLDIGAETVPEIATSIVAQLVAVRRKGRAVRGAPDMRDR